MTGWDIPVLTIIFLFVQWRAKVICQRNLAMRDLYRSIALGITIWFFYSFTKEWITKQVFTLAPVDQLFHDEMGHYFALQYAQVGFLDTLKNHFAFGNRAYDLFVGTVYRF